MQLNGFKYSERLNISNWAINEILTDTATPGQSGPESNGNEGVLYILQTVRLEPYYQM